MRQILRGEFQGDGAVEPRHVDLRPFAITGKDTWVLPGGLTRVALVTIPAVGQGLPNPW